ncbi:putative acyl- dehydrogenase [Rosellinia necatrix]|uniref:Putative acyl-dehydrogenase n=1 Tax=Rosellinia necatrix TaxID=77044 RepID=A0A1S7ULP3_ROSNE|nr:putative acyl- dehydrogenase [Rosellinia necatrix]
MAEELPWAEPAWLSSLESPYYNDSHRRLQAYARKFYDEHVIPHMLEWAEKGDCPESARAAYRASGLASVDIPREYRPAGADTVAGIPVDELDTFHRLILTDEGSRVEGGAGIALAGGANVIGLPPVVRHGTEAQKRRWLPGALTGATSFCLGVTEPGGGSDVSAIRTTARRTADGSRYVVTGTKKWITGSPWATHMTTAVRTGTAASGAAGISLLVVPLSLPGVSVERIANSGQGAGGASWVRLDGVEVPADHLLGAEGAGFAHIMANFNGERFVMAVGCNRKARTCLAAALAYARDRETFGAPLVGHQVIRHKLVHLAREVEAHWARLEQIAYHVERRGWRGGDIAGPVAMAKISGGRLLERAAREAQQVMGGVAYQRGGPGGGGLVEQIARDLRMMVVGGGSEEILGDLAFREEMKTAKSKARARAKL